MTPLTFPKKAIKVLTNFRNSSVQRKAVRERKQMFKFRVLLLPFLKLQLTVTDPTELIHHFLLRNKSTELMRSMSDSFNKYLLCAEIMRRTSCNYYQPR